MKVRSVGSVAAISVVTSRPMPIVLVVLDAFPNDIVDETTTPTLAALAAEGGRQRRGGVAELTAATYPNHATFVTGATTVEHGIVTNRVLDEHGDWTKSSAVGPGTPTLFDACRAEGRSTAAVVGDHELIGVCGGRTADVHWPPDGVVPTGTDLGICGYVADHEVVRAAAGLDLADADFVFAQIDEVDGVRHRFGARGVEARDQCRSTDAALGAFLELFRSVWDDTVVLVVSDHDHEDLSSADPVDVSAYVDPPIRVEPQGTAALVVGPAITQSLRSIEGVSGVVALDPTRHVVWGHAGQSFGSDRSTNRADHGSPRTQTQLAIVGGGHAQVPAVAAQLEGRRPRPTAWATWVAELLALEWRPGEQL